MTTNGKGAVKATIIYRALTVGQSWAISFVSQDRLLGSQIKEAQRGKVTRLSHTVSARCI